MVSKRFLMVGSLLLALVAGRGQAQVFPIQGTGAEGAPGQQVFVRLVYDYGASFSLIAEDLQFEYQFAGITFNPDASTIDVSGSPQSLTQFADSLRTFAQMHQGNVLVNLNPSAGLPGYKGYALSFFTSDGSSHIRSGQVHLDVAFDILPNAVPGAYAVSFTGRNALADADGNEFTYPVALQNLAVNVVPEPHIALMLLPGIALVILLVRRRGGVRAG